MIEEQYRAAIYRKGAMTEFYYGKDLVKLKRRAVKALNNRMFSTEPDKVVLEIKVGSLGKNNSLWRTLEVVPADSKSAGL